MKINRNWLLILCLVLVVALCGTVFGFAQGGGIVPGLSAEQALPTLSPPSSMVEDAEGTLGKSGDWTLGASSGLQLQKIELSQEEVPVGGQLTVTLGASGCTAESYQADITFVGLESGEVLQASARSNPSNEELTLRARLTADGPADTYALRSVLLLSEGELEAAFYSRGSDERPPSASLLPAEASFRAVDPNGEFNFYLSDPELVQKLQKLGSSAKAVVFYGAKDEENYLAETEIFKTAQENGFALLFEDGNALWGFSGGAITEPQQVDLEIRGEYSLPALEELIDWTTPYYAFSLSGEGDLPAPAEISLQIGQMSRFDGGGLYLYRYDETANKLELIASGLSADEGALSFRTAHRGTYVLCKGPAQPRQEAVSQPEEQPKTEYAPIDEGETVWLAIRDEIDGAQPGATVSVRIEKEEPIPYWIIRYLCGKDVQLTLSDGSSLITLDGLSLDPPQRRPVFKLADLQELFS